MFTKTFIGSTHHAVLSRVYLLFQHISIESLDAGFSTPSSKQSGGLETRPVVHLISNTIANLLSFLSNEAIHASIVTDLINILTDCCIILESSMLPVKMAILDETLARCSTEEEYFLEICSLEEARLLQTATLIILHSFLLNTKRKRLRSSDHFALEPLLGGEQTVPTGALDILFPPNLVDKTNMSSLFMALRHALLSDQSPSNSLWSLQKGTAMNVLKDLFEDWQKYGASPTNHVEGAILIVRATQQYLASEERKSQEFESMAVSLLHNIIIHPPQLNATTSSGNIMLMVRSTIVQPMLDCVQFISKRLEKNCRELDVTIFRIIHAILHTNEESQKSGFLLDKAITYSMSHGVFHWLFHSLRNPSISSFAIGILGALLYSADSGTGSKEFEQACRLALKGPQLLKDLSSVIASESRDADADSGNDKGLVGPTAGVKRKRNSKSSSRPLPLEQLRISTSTNDTHNKANNEAEGFFRPSFWTDEVSRFLNDAVLAGRRLEEMMKDSGSSREASTVTKDLVLVTNGLRLILNQCWRHCQCRQINPSSLATFMSVADLLMSGIHSCSERLRKDQKDERSESDFFIAQAIIDCGIYVHFYVKPYITVFGHDDQHSLLRLLDALASLAVHFAKSGWVAERQNLLFKPMKPCCCYAPSCPPIIFGQSQSAGLQERKQSGQCTCDLCICSLASDIKNTNESNFERVYVKKSFSLDCSMIVFDSLPFRSRCYLMASIHNPSTDFYDDSNPVESSSETFVFDSLFSPTKLSRSRTEITGSYTSALVYAPLILMSTAYSGLQSGTTDDSKHPSRLTASMVKSFQKFVNPIMATIEGGKDDDTIDALLWTLTRLKWLDSQMRGGLNLDRFLHAENLIAYFFARLDFEANEEAPVNFGSRRDGESSLLLCDLMFAVAQKVNEDHPNPYIRRRRWECMASACMDYPMQSLRQIAVSKSKKTRDLRGNHTLTASAGSHSWLFWLLSTPISDPDPFVRETLSNEVNKIIMRENYCLLFSLFASNDDIEAFKTYMKSTKLEKQAFQSTNVLTHASDRVVSALFRALDSQLHAVCSLADSQLSFTVSKSDQANSSRKDLVASGDTFLFQRTAVKMLASLCQNANLDDPVGIWFFEKAFIRLIRMWASSSVEKLVDPLFPDILSTTQSRALSFGELVDLSASCSLRHLITERLSKTFGASVFCDILILSSSQRRETQYHRLEAFIHSFMNGIKYGQSKKSMTKEALVFIEGQLPAIICQFVIENDVELLRLTAGFKEFLEGGIKAARKKIQYESPIVGSSNAPSRKSVSALSLSDQELERKTRHLCLQPNMIERILPLILINSDRSGLIFFLTKVLGEISFREIIQNREQLILKELVWELGNETSTVGPAVQAIRVAATALLSEPSGQIQSGEMVRSNSVDSSLATQWASSHFMYLLCNVIQYRWNSRTRKEQLHALRSLFGLLNFLLPSESAQYFPQIMATVNAAMLNNSDSSTKSSDGMCLQLLAIKCLSKFVRLVADHQLDTVATNLTNVVVSLIPILTDTKQEDINCRQHWAVRESQDEAISLLEHLTHGEIGKVLAPHFKEIPFLPQAGALKAVHEALRSNKVDFDNLVVISSETQQHGRRGSLTSENSLTFGSKSSMSSSKSFERMTGLQKRLKTMTELLDNENISVRNVVLQHLTDLLRANRELFHNLVTSEDSLSSKHCLTVLHKSPSRQSNSKVTNWLPQGTVTRVMEKLLSRCVQESDQHTRLLLAACLGEFGAIGEHHLGDLKIGSLADDSLDSPNSAYQWRLEQPPWNTKAATKYGLQLVTRHLVIALKAAPSSSDQHKVAFSIQQLLVLLDRWNQPKQDTVGSETSVNTKEMTEWLRDRLNEGGVYEIVEPFWFSEFNERAEGYVLKEPPFFESSPSYYSWMSNFCRWMISNAHNSLLSPWKDFFHACRTAIRTQAGLLMTEFILPLLILDRICFGTKQDEVAICQEFLSVLNSKSPSMSQTDFQRAVSTIFMVIQTLSFWAERETEERFKSSRSSTSSTRKKRGSTITHDDLWPADNAIQRIEDLIFGIPLSVQAQAAARVGMHARALRLLEMDRRRHDVERVYESSIDQQKRVEASSRQGDVYHQNDQIAVNSIEVELMKDVLVQLDDCETMVAIGGDSVVANPMLQVRDSIRRNVASGDFQGALQDSERALQLTSVVERDPSLEKGVLQCLLELGQFESVLNQVAGMTHRHIDDAKDMQSMIAPFAVEAAWRLGRWDTLSDLIKRDADEGNTSQRTTSQQIEIGKAMLGLRQKDKSMVMTSLENARALLMQNLSSEAQESYSRSYSNIVGLHCIRELENAADVLCLKNNDSPFTLDEIAYSTSNEGWAWDGRLSFTTSHGASPIINTRVALARLYGEPALEGQLFLSIGKRARKNGLYSIAENFFSKAEVAFTSITTTTTEISTNSKLENLLDSTKTQLAKLKHESGESALALKILGHDSVQSAFGRMTTQMENLVAVRKIAIDYERQRIGTLSNSSMHLQDEKSLTDRFAKRLLRLTQWMVEGGLKGGSEITRRYRVIHKLAPEWEKGHFYFAKYIDSIMQSRVTALASQYFDQEALHGVDEDLVRTSIIFRDLACHKYILMAMNHYATALKLDPKHVYQALPRLLSLWFDFASIDPKSQIVPKGFKLSDYEKILSRHKNEANACMASNLKVIPAAAFYTAMPQLISRVIHTDKETSLVVQNILKRVLVKFPQQAMWPLAWLKGSKKPERLQIGENIFKEAQKTFDKGNKSMQKLLAETSSLFKFLKDLAMYTPTNNQGSIGIKPWKGVVDLSEFLPPVQAALYVSPLSKNGSNKDFFPRNMPRMRAFSSRVKVMASKAKPKRIMAYAVPGSFKRTKKTRDSQKTNSPSNELSYDIGEIHFLVKQEAKGDLRKDARVQDLNNVINRLMASASENSSTRTRRRLHLRTFTVTCLSEDTGILEWVPKTESLRSLVSRSYNPQTSSFCPRRRGGRLANFGDATLRSNYERCQSTYFKDGNLSRATTLFDELCLKPYPPLLYWYFVQKFHDPHAWYEARNRFTLSSSAWSAVGHVIGLGDRHSENILIDTNSGDCVHVDFDCIFDKGLNLPRPEVVPFRLTANMLDAFGPSGHEGVYTSGLQTAMRTLRDNRDTLLSVLEPFLKDPIIDWKRYRSQQKSSTSTTQAKRSVKVIDERLRGVYNLRNPNLKKYRRTDGLSADQDDELTHLLPLSVEGQVNKMIAEATSSENLVQLYVGWMPWV